MKQLPCILLLSLLMSLVCVRDGSGESIVIHGERVNVRSGPGRTFDVVGIVNRNEKFELLETQDGWLQISVEGILGWIPQKSANADDALLGTLLEQADNYFYAQQFTTPPEANAYDLYREVLDRDPDNQHALQRIQQMIATYKSWADAAYSRKEYEKAKVFYQRYLFLGPEDDSVKQRLEHLPAGDSTAGGSLRILNLRSQPAVVDSQELCRMLAHYSFHHPSDWSKFNLSPSISGDFRHDYVRKELEGFPVVIDHATRLMWQRPDNLEDMNWTQAAQHVTQLNAQTAAGVSDWRLPTIEELASLMEGRKSESGLYLSPLFGAAPLWCWSSDRSSEPERAWFISFNSGGIQQHALNNNAFVLAVRSLDKD